MIDIKPLLRKAYIDKLAGLTYLAQSVPVDHEYLTSEPAVLPVGNSTLIEAYVIINNQTVNDNSYKCGINQSSSLQLAVTTVFNANSGNSLHSELIANEIFALLFTENEKRIYFDTEGLGVWRAWLESSRVIVEETKDKRIFRNILIFNHSVTQFLPEPPITVWDDSLTWDDTLIWAD